jgi:hypothetical protein
MQKKRLLTNKDMTLPDERYRAVMWAKRFLEDLCNNAKDYPRVPSKVRSEAYSILRHFPSEWDMKHVSNTSPEVFQERMEPLTRMLEVYKIEQKEENNGK